MYLKISNLISKPNYSNYFNSWANYYSTNLLLPPPESTIGFDWNISKSMAIVQGSRNKIRLNRIYINSLLSWNICRERGLGGQRCDNNSFLPGGEKGWRPSGLSQNYDIAVHAILFCLNLTRERGAAKRTLLHCHIIINCCDNNSCWLITCKLPYRTSVIYIHTCI